MLRLLLRAGTKYVKSNTTDATLLREDSLHVRTQPHFATGCFNHRYQSLRKPCRPAHWVIAAAIE